MRTIIQISENEAREKLKKVLYADEVNIEGWNRPPSPPIPEPIYIERIRRFVNASGGFFNNAILINLDTKTGEIWHTYKDGKNTDKYSLNNGIIYHIQEMLASGHWKEIV